MKNQPGCTPQLRLRGTVGWLHGPFDRLTVATSPIYFIKIKEKSLVRLTTPHHVIMLLLDGGGHDPMGGGDNMDVQCSKCEHEFTPSKVGHSVDLAELIKDMTEEEIEALARDLAKIADLEIKE